MNTDYFHSILFEALNNRITIEKKYYAYIHELFVGYLKNYYKSKNKTLPTLAQKKINFTRLSQACYKSKEAQKKAEIFPYSLDKLISESPSVKQFISYVESKIAIKKEFYEGKSIEIPDCDPNKGLYANIGGRIYEFVSLKRPSITRGQSGVYPFLIMIVFLKEYLEKLGEIDKVIKIEKGNLYCKFLEDTPIKNSDPEVKKTIEEDVPITPKKEIIKKDNSSTSSTLIDRETIEYYGYCYSYKWHEVLKFNFKIQQIKLHVYSLTQSNFHTSPDFKDIEFEGIGDDASFVVRAILKEKNKNKPRPEQVHIMVRLDQFYRQKEVLLGSISAISSHQDTYPMDAEVVFLKKSEWSEPKELIIERILFLHRYNYRIRPKSIFLNSDLRARGVKVSLLADIGFVGHFRVWRFDFDDKGYNLVQSYLFIDDNYRAICKTLVENGKSSAIEEQVCLIKPIKDFDDRKSALEITAHPKNNIGTISTMMIHIPKEEKKDKQNMITFAGTINYRNKNGTFPIWSPILFIQEKSIINPKIISKSEIKSLPEPLIKTFEKFKRIVKYSMRNVKHLINED